MENHFYHIKWPPLNCSFFISHVRNLCNGCYIVRQCLGHTPLPFCLRLESREYVIWDSMQAHVTFVLRAVNVIWESIQAYVTFVLRAVNIFYGIRCKRISTSFWEPCICYMGFDASASSHREIKDLIWVTRLQSPKMSWLFNTKNACQNVCLLVNVSIEVNSVDPRSDCSKKQSDLDLHCLPKRLHKHFSDDESRLVVTCKFSVITVTTFMEYAHVCAAQTSYFKAFAKL